MSDPVWVTATGSVRGARHERLGEPNEDAAGASALGPVLVVADGHGSARCPRARTGARLAVAAATEVLATPTDDPASELVGAWRARVDHDLAADPPEGTHGEDGYRLYGSTVLCAAVHEDALLLLQLGDGDILLGGPGFDGGVSPIPPITYDVPGATDSLAHHDAADRVRIARIDLRSTPVGVVLLATDGLGTAYEDPAWHDATMTDLLQRLGGLGPRALDTTLESWCGPPARIGGDDTTMGLLVRSELLAAGTA